MPLWADMNVGLCVVDVSCAAGAGFLNPPAFLAGTPLHGITFSRIVYIDIHFVYIYNTFEVRK